MDAIYSSTALRDHPREVKQAARERIVRITENGQGAYVFCSEDVFQHAIDAAVDEALYAERAKEAIAQGRVAYQQGDYVIGLDAGRAAVAAMRSQHD